MNSYEKKPSGQLDPDSDHDPDFSDSEFDFSEDTRPPDTGTLAATPTGNSMPENPTGSTSTSGTPAPVELASPRYRFRHCPPPDYYGH